MQPGHDVRCPAALLTYKMAAITSRAGPTGAAPGTGGPGAALMPLCVGAGSEQTLGLLHVRLPTLVT
jgi:hypothetical protein